MASETSEPVIGTLSEVKPLREVPRPREHCGKPMRKLGGVSTTQGIPVIVYSCDKCGAQERVKQEA